VVVYSARDLDDAELLRLHTHADAVISKGRLNGQASARLREEVLLAITRQARGKGEAPAAAAARHGALLVVDDDVRNQAALSKALRSRGFAVSVAGSGAQALDMLVAGNFAAVLTDIMMPEMDGYELIRRNACRYCRPDTDHRGHRQSDARRHRTLPRRRRHRLSGQTGRNRPTTRGARKMAMT
jgi:hypothetical protein